MSVDEKPRERWLGSDVASPGLGAGTGNNRRESTAPQPERSKDDGSEQDHRIFGHRLGTVEVESALVSHETVAEAAVVDYPHNIKGEGMYAYVTLKQGVEPTDKLHLDIQNLRATALPG